MQFRSDYLQTSTFIWFYIDQCNTDKSMNYSWSLWILRNRHSFINLHDRSRAYSECRTINLGEKISQKEEKPAGQANPPPPTTLTQFYFQVTFMHEMIKPAYYVYYLEIFTVTFFLQIIDHAKQFSCTHQSTCVGDATRSLHSWISTKTCRSQSSGKYLVFLINN